MKSNFWLLAPVVLIMLAISGWVTAQPYPTKYVRIITAAAGGGLDFTTRLIAAPLGVALGQQVIVENRGLLATDVAAKAPPDGYTLLVQGQTLWLLPFMRNNVASNVSDFTPITTATETGNILVVHPLLPVKSVKSLLALAKARPGELNFTTSGNGNSVHIAGALFKWMTGIKVVRINYRAASLALADLISGQTQFMFAVPGSSMPHIKSGRLRALAVTSAKRLALLPDLPTVAKTVPGFEVTSRIGIFAPVGTPPAIVNRLNEEIARALNRPEVKKKFHASGIETVGDSPEELGALIKAEMARMGKVIKEAGIRAN